MGAGAVASGLAVANPAFATGGTPANSTTTVPPAVTIGPTDPRYADLQLRNWNKLYKATPESFRIVRNAAQVAQAVADAVSANKRIAIRSGGHGLDGLVEDTAMQIIIDFSEMRAITYDTARNAFCIEPGATLGQIYRSLDLGWEVTLPAGLCPAVGAGGHIIGGGAGALSRQHGLVSDHLYAVEVVTVNAAGAVVTTIATRETNDPNRELWWAHAGGGGGNFGVVTRFWMRSPGPVPTSAATALPKRPGALMTGRAIWNWSAMDQVSFIQLLKNYGVWHEANSAPGQAGNQLYASLIAPRKEAGRVIVSAQVDPTVQGNEQLLNNFLTTLTTNVTPHANLINTGRQPWQYTTVNATDTAVAMGVQGPPRSRTKGALLIKRYTDDQAATIHQYLTSTTYSHSASSFSISSYGGQINAASGSAIAAAHRSAVMLASVFSCWDVAADDSRHLTWNREFYQALHADTGGYPTPNARYDGLFLNWPDTDVLDPTWNTSPVQWPALYHKGNYTRLRQAKAVWDPRNIFRHKLSVQLP
ncbi:FAD-binding oxidoreductase [Streptomyces amakusaensis]